MPTTGFRFALVMLVGVLVIAACGGSNSASSSSPAPPTPPQQGPADALTAVASAAASGDAAIVAARFARPDDPVLVSALSDRAFLAAFGRSIANATQVSNDGTSATYRATFDHDGRQLGFYVYLKRSSDGRWKIVGL
jgi:hypothetical protein